MWTNKFPSLPSSVKTCMKKNSYNFYLCIIRVVAREINPPKTFEWFFFFESKKRNCSCRDNSLSLSVSLLVISLLIHRWKTYFSISLLWRKFSNRLWIRFKRCEVSAGRLRTRVCRRRSAWRVGGDPVNTAGSSLPFTVVHRVRGRDGSCSRETVREWRKTCCEPTQTRRRGPPVGVRVTTTTTTTVVARRHARDRGGVVHFYGSCSFLFTRD